MKKIFLLIAAISITLGGMAQKGKVNSALTLIEQGELDKAKTTLDEAMVHPKSKDWTNTYYAKGKLFQAIYDAKDTKYASYSADPLADAYAAYQKAIEIDEKDASKKKIITNSCYNLLVISYGDQGITKFQAGDFTGALKSFDTQIQIMESDLYVGAIDTGIYYNAGLAALNSKDYNAGVKYFQKCIDLKYLGITPHFQLAECYTGMGQAQKAEQYLLDLPKMFPEDKNITLSLIDMYIKNNQFEKAIQYIDIAKADDPTNYSLYYASGIMYLNQLVFDKAIADLTKAHQLKDDIFDTNYGLGAAYINYGGDLFLKANDLIDIKAYNEAVEVANTQYFNALPYMEKALEFNPDNIDVMTSLKELYFRLRQKDAALNQKYNEINAKIQALENK